MRQTVFVLVLDNGLKFLWTIAQMSERAPVIEFAPGHVRLIFDKADNLKLLDILDAIMAERRAGTYLGLHEQSPRVKSVEMEVRPGHGYCYPEYDWSFIIFSSDINLRHFQERIDRARRLLSG